VRQKGDLLGPPPVVLHPESIIAAQAAYTKALLPRSAPGAGPNCFQALGSSPGLLQSVCVECSIGKQKKPILFKVTEPSSVPYRAPPACAKRAAYPDPPPVILLPESIAAQAAYQLRYKNTEYYSWVSLRPEMFPGIGALPKPATVNRGTPVAPRRLKAQGKRVTRVGSPCSPVFPNIMSCLKSPITAKPRVTH